MLSLLVALCKPSPKITKHVTFTVSHGGKEVGEIKLGLFGEVVPKTVENFYQIAAREPTSDNPMGYKGTIFHRIIPQFMIQGGDFERRDGTGGSSIYGAQFEDENFKIGHRPFCLSMANAGPGTNGAQFFITTVKTGWLNNKHVVFGHVVAGQDVVTQLEAVPKNQSDRPLQDVVIEKVVVDDAFEPYTIEF